MKFLMAILCSLMFLSTPLAAKKKIQLKKPKVEIVTSMGKMAIELDRKAAPKTVDNFLKYVDAKFYDGTIFHRVIKNFMIQGGGFTQGKTGPKKEKTTRDPIKNEGKLPTAMKNDRGTIAMARTNDPHSATSQFYINHKDNAFLNSKPTKWGYVAFGKIADKNKIESEKTLDKIAKVKTMPTDEPMKVVTIKSIRRMK